MLAEDRYGRMNLTKEGVAARDSLVYELCFENDIPLVYTVGGGYQKDIEKIVEAHVGSPEALRRYVVHLSP